MKNLRIVMLGILCLVIIGALVAGCGGGSSSPSPSPSASVAPSVAPSEAPSTAPSEAPSEPPASITWASYNGTVLPSANIPAFTWNETAGTSTNTLNPGGTLTFDTTSATTNKADWRITNFFTAAPSKVTMIFRMKYNATSPITSSTPKRAAEIDLQTAFSGTASPRIKLIVNSNTNTTAHVQIEKADGTNSINDLTVDTSAWHIYQITYDITSASATVNVYVDGTLLTAFTNSSVTQTSTSNTFLIGDGGSNDYSCDIDWVAWTFDGVYTPTQLSGKLPAGLGLTTGY